MKIFESLFAFLFRVPAFAALMFAVLLLPMLAQAQTRSFTEDPTTANFGADLVVQDDLSVRGDEVLQGPRGAEYTTYWVTAQTAALTSGATATCGTNIIPAGSTVYGCVIRVTTLVTGATSIDVGDGTDADKWGDNIAVTAGTTTTAASFTVGTATPINYPTATALTLTANGSNFTAGVVRCACLLGKFTALSN